MINEKRIIAALNQLHARTDEYKEFLATRKKIGADMDPDNVHVIHCFYTQVLDPYGICPAFPTELYQIGREYFAIASDGPVSFDDLPGATVTKLWQRMQAGDFDRATPAWEGVSHFGWSKDDHPFFPYKMFWQPTLGPLAAVPLAGRVAIRTTTEFYRPLIVKDADLGSFALTIGEGNVGWHLAGWIDVGAAKQFPSLTAHGSAVHFIDPSQLGDLDDMRKFVETGLGKRVDAMHET